MRVLAFDIGGTAIKLGIMNEKGEILENREIPTLAKEGGKKVLNRILKIIGEYNNIDGIGISTLGQIDYIDGKVLFASENIPGWTGMEIKKTIEEVYKIPTAVENDVNAAAIGEAHYGAGAGQKSFICLAFGTGIGGAIIENGKVYRGALNGAGEFGHIITHGGGRSCNCGGKGCYETYASTTALVKAVKEQLNMKEVDGRKIFQYLQAGNQDIKKIVDAWVQEILIGLTNVIHIFNPSLIVLGGGIMSQPYIIQYIKKNLQNYIMPNYNPIEIEQAKLGNNAGILGAAHQALNLIPK